MPLPRQRTLEGQALALDLERQQQLRRADNQVGSDAKAIDGADTITIDAGGQRTIYHGLGRQPTGWRITDRNVAGDVWRVSWNKTQLVLATNAAAAITIQVEVM